MKSSRASQKKAAWRLNECDPRLKLLYQEHRFFELRDGVAKKGQQKLYRGAVACVFHQFPRWQAQLASLVASAPQSEEAYEAHHLLSWMHLRRGNFPQALTHLEAMLSRRPEEGGSRGADGLRSTVARFPKQITVHHCSCSVPYELVEENMFVPVVVNGKPANFMIDSGATISMITATEADRLGLSIQAASRSVGTLYGATGTQTEFQTAVAAQICVHGLELANVAFLVLKDHQFQFQDAYRGALGLPVLLAFETLRWGPDGIFHIGFPSQQPYSPQANICFDGAEPVTEVMFQRRKLSFALDTGSGRTILGPTFSKQFAKLVGRYGRSRSIVVSGISGSARLKAIRLPAQRFRVGGRTIMLRHPYVLQQPTTPNSGWLSGRLGMDVLNGARQVTLDFRRMSLKLG